jgi:tryptophan synthase alpha chain
MSQHKGTFPVMAHLVLGYPTLAASLETAEQYIAAGVQILELQIPFSHPTADGPVITAACQAATRQGVSVRDCIDAIGQLRSRHPQQEIMVMSYLNRLYTFGFQDFMAAMGRLGVRHLIVPDLPIRSHATALLPLTKGAEGGVRLVPVLAANVSDARLDELLATDYDFFYLMSDFKITGSTFSLHPRLEAIIQKIKAVEGRRVGIGFGISTPQQAKWVTASADVAIIGSALIQARQRGQLASYLSELNLVL